MEEKNLPPTGVIIVPPTDPPEVIREEVQAYIRARKESMTPEELAAEQDEIAAFRKKYSI